VGWRVRIAVDAYAVALWMVFVEILVCVSFRRMVANMVICTGVFRLLSDARPRETMPLSASQSEAISMMTQGVGRLSFPAVIRRACILRFL
jgi:hypothetical protein